MRSVLPLCAAVLWALQYASAQVLTPSHFTISYRKPIVATATCGEINGQPIKEMYCSLAGATSYSPLNQYSYHADESQTTPLQEYRNTRELNLQGGHGCDFCEAGSPTLQHPAANMVDGTNDWWLSPPLSRGMQYTTVNITVDLEQEFHVAYVWIQMANSPRPGTWVLERSADYGKTYQPWFYFANNDAECMRRFGVESLLPIDEDESVICRSDFSSIQPLENGEIMINLMEHRPSRHSFATSETLQNFTRATNVRFRLLGPKTLQGHLIDLNEKNDPTVTRRYFYAIKEIIMGGRCVCNGHAGTCDILDPKRPRAHLCRCEHNTCGDQCDRCCPGYEQKPWKSATEDKNFVCEPCNCFGRSNECEYDVELDRMNKSLDINGNYQGGGRCSNCRDNTQGINCNECVFGYYRPEGTEWNATRPCTACRCDPNKHTGGCAELTGKCECLPRFEGEDCDRCAKGYYDAPECKKCECAVEGTVDEACRPTDGQCPCKPGFGGTFCETCSPGHTNFTAGCVECQCDATGSEHSNCSAETGQCACKAGFSGVNCDRCQLGHFGFPSCTFCNCDPLGTEGGECDASSGQCLCKEGFAGDKCDQCDIGFYGYPHCKPCGCEGAGSKSTECDVTTGQCPCFGNFTARTCDKCAAGYFDYPNCKKCSCLIEGSKGQTCDSQGQCYCKDNFEGDRCEKCRPNFYNFPACEECNCNPSGVTLNFAGCDKVAPGELCSCREHVTGRICDQCKAGFWDLQYHHTEGCVDCDCHLPGTLSAINLCSAKSGQCHCKRNAAGRQCDKCADGYYNMTAYNVHSCEPCNCDIGGALRSECDAKGQCRCRPRVTGLRCDKPITDHYFPTLWHNQYEAEDGHTEDNRAVRFASDEAQFPGNFSWRGYAVLSTIQEKIIMDVDISKSSVYRILFRYHNPTPVPITAVVAAAPQYTNTHDFEQSEKIVFPPTTTATIKEITVAGKPFVLNPGKWAISVATKQRLFLDYIVILPAEYYQGSVLKDRVAAPCTAEPSNSTCVDLLFPPLPEGARVDANKKNFRVINEDGTTTDLERVPIEIVPEIIGPAAFVRTGENNGVFETVIEVPSDDEYAVVVEYHNREKTSYQVALETSQNGETLLNGTFVVHHCPYSAFCRELVTSNGTVPFVPLKAGEATVILFVPKMHQFGIAAVNLIRKKDWSIEYLQQVPVCIRKNGKCMSQEHPPAPNAVVADAAGAPNIEKSIAGDKLPFPIAKANDVSVVPLDSGEGTLDIHGVVPQKGHYMFLVHFYNPDNTPLTLSALIHHDDQVFEGIVNLPYCPSVTGCRALIRDKDRPEVIQYYVEDKYVATLRYNDTQKGPVYIDSITAIPFHSYSDSLMTPLPIDLSEDYVTKCSSDFFRNHPDDVSDYCREKIFSITTDFNAAALSCDCNARGSESFCCDEYGGQCKCKPNVIGRRCDRCAPGYYNYPECIKCKCVGGQMCDEQTGKCFCPPHVEGATCDKCVGYAFGYDPLIGCQKCGCHPQGSEGGALQCDPNSGQCLCRESVGGRQCDRCLPGYYGFPHCYKCQCSLAGTTEDICDGNNAQCKCKENVYGAACDTCKAGTFDLSAENPMGCSNCFCFGVTDQCRSSQYPVTVSSFEMSQFNVNDLSGQLSVDDETVIYTSTDASPESVYFNAPIDHGQDYTTSYGLAIFFKLSVTPREGETKLSSQADVRLIGKNITAEYWAPEQPADPKETFAVRVKIAAENFLTTDGKPLTREEMMMLLHSLENITVKASYYEKPASAKLVEFGLEMSGDRNQHSVYRAASVEQCNCPAPYMGASCQLCAPGFHRVQSGQFLGACVACDCNGHSGTCDPDTGICSDCQHNTYGDHCEFCLEGHFGDATTGSPYACQPCQCPFAPENNFASACQVNDYGDVTSCTCKPGYIGETCDRCAPGFFGEPRRPGGTCQPCNCHGNNNLTDARSCHPLTGDCYQCEGNTDGRHCEWCKQWYFGDAITEKNCAECSCNQCGSSFCNNTLGACECKANVHGANCDSCKPDFWGFSKCRGCEACNCGVASSSTQCNGDNGQCPCRPGATGARCEHCEHGYWDYSENGCKKCDCEADLSMGTVCDVRTGQCHCQEGATGSRCDQCQTSYLRIPTMGCRRCDECVHHLMEDVDNLGIDIEVLNVSISNISSSTVVGARLSKNKKTLMNFEDLTSILTPGSEGTYGKFLEHAKAALNSRSALLNSANRTKSTAEKDFGRSKNLTNDGMEKMKDIRELAETARWVVDSLTQLTISIGSESSALVIDPKLLQDAEEILHDLEARSAREQSPLLESAPETVKKTQANVAEQKTKLGDQKERIQNTKNKNEELYTFFNDAQMELKDSKTVSDKVEQKSNAQSVAKVEALYKAISDDHEKMIAAADQTKATILKVSNQTETMRDTRESIADVLVTLNDTRAELAEHLEKQESARRRRDTVDVEGVNARKQELVGLAQGLNQTFGSARDESQNAVDAANAYANITSSLQNAREKSEYAKDLVAEEQEGITELKSRITNARSKSEADLKTTGTVRHTDLADLEKQAKDVEINVEKTSDLIESLRHQRETMKQNLEDGKLNATLFTAIDDGAEKVGSLTKDINETMKNTQEEVKNLQKDTDDTVSAATDSIQGVKTARSNVKSLAEMEPKLKESYKSMESKSAARTAKLEAVSEKISAIREKIAVARDAANRIKLGAHFEQGSSIDLNIPHRVARSAAYTNIDFFFKTTKDHGIPLFFGNEKGSAGTRAVPTDDFIAIEIEGAPKVTMDLGDAPVVVKLDTRVADNQWRRLSVERIGKSIEVTLYKPNSNEVQEVKRGVSTGNKSVFNLHQTQSKLFVGGIPRNSRLSTAVRNRDFEGDIEDLQMHGEPVGLWSAKSEGMVRVNGTIGRRKNADTMEQTGVSLNGDGYIEYGISYWNPRKKAVFSLSFLTFSPEGLLFFIGKDPDFLALQLSDGHVKLSLDFGSGPAHWSTEETFNDGKWHNVAVTREQRQVKMEVDGVTVVEGEAPGKETELSVTDNFYLGGTPPGVNTRSSAEALRGCLKSVRLDADEVDLHMSQKSKGVRSACPLGIVHTITLLSERSSAKFTAINATEDIEVTLKFKTRQPTGTLFIVKSEEDEIVSLKVDNGYLNVDSGDDKLSVEVASVSDEQWHYVSVRRTKTNIRIDVDDLYTNQVQRANGEEANNVAHADENVSITFGETASFEGCIGDVTYNGELLDFAKADVKEVSLTGCALKDDMIKTTLAPVTAATQEPSEAEATESAAIEETTPKTTSAPAKVRGPNECALMLTPLGERDHSDGHRFGLERNSRIEYDVAPETFDKSGTFSVEVRATATSGVILFATNEKHTDHIALFLLDGKVGLSIDTGSGPETLTSNRSILDDEWHNIKATRRGNVIELIVDEETVSAESKSGTDGIDTQPPLYLGGVPSELASFTRTLNARVKPQFMGCIRDLKLNDKSFDGKSQSHGVEPCSTFTEKGVYFGENRGYAILSKEFEVGNTFAAEIEVRPRVQNGIIFSVGVLEYLTVSLVNGKIHFVVDNGKGQERLVYNATNVNSLCDGQWHTIKIMKKKNLITLTVDGNSNLIVLKKGKKQETVTKDPFYLGGIPPNGQNKGLETTDGFVGCVRILSFGGGKKEERQRRNPLNLDEVELHGDVNRESCPVN